VRVLSSKNELICFLLISLFILGHETFLLYDLTIFWYAVKLIVPLALFMYLINFQNLTIRKVRLTKECKVVFYVYMAFIAYGHVVNLFSEDVADSMITGYKFFMKFFFFFAVALVLHAFIFSHRLIKFPMYIGLFFAVQSIILIVRLWLGIPPETQEVLFEQEAFSDGDPWISYGVWGYGNWRQLYVGESGMGLMVRAQSFFSEASNLGKFLLYPVFISWGLYALTAKYRYLAICILCFIGMMATLSITVTIAFATTVLLYLILKEKLVVKKFILGAVLFATFISMASVAWDYFLEIYNPDTSSASLVEAMLGRTDVSVTYRVDWSLSVVDLVKERPLGIGFVSPAHSRYLDLNNPSALTQNPFAPMSWLLRTGFLGLGMMCFILIYVYLKILRKQIRQNNISRYIALAFIAQILVHVGHGNWIDPMFFFTLALVLSLHRNQIKSEMQLALIRK